MLCFQSLHCSLLGRWVQAFQLQLRGRCRRRKAKQLFSGLPTPFGAMEFSNQLKHVFKLIDANSDGKISSLELKEVLMCLGEDKSKAAKEAEVMVKEVDCNGDGFIDMEEFMGVVGGKSERSREELMDAFLIFDRDRNGFISAEELRRVLVSLGYGKCTLKECFLMIRGVDMNGDGLIDFEEFRLMMTRCGGVK
eukprot:TRINITY_DN29120_c0_g1_i1.p1 TRINITY_DN29120_c0_g1~~TRINITY_DN29120_c0_g1_i1.p1  ORF type:complete len:194 (-),score=46.05 TRINITY_DN29120_c0_g1_i1:342-923(-)